MKNVVNRKALKLLLRYDALAEGDKARGHPLSPGAQAYLQAHVLADEDLACLQRHGLTFDAAGMAHDEAVEICFALFRQCRKEQVTDLFLAGLGQQRPDYRSALSAYAIMQSMPEHRYQSAEPETGYCRTCSGKKDKDRLDRTALNRDRFQYGALLLLKTPYEIQFFLQQHGQLEPVQPVDQDFRIFNQIIALLDNADADLKPRDTHKLLSTIAGFKSTKFQATALLETLGYCGILEADPHRGYLTQYTNPGLAPSKSRSSDWAYPVDFWTGRDRVNWQAMQFWFGPYPQVDMARRTSAAASS